MLPIYTEKKHVSTPFIFCHLGFDLEWNVSKSNQRISHRRVVSFLIHEKCQKIIVKKSNSTTLYMWFHYYYRASKNDRCGQGRFGGINLDMLTITDVETARSVTQNLMRNVSWILIFITIFIISIKNIKCSKSVNFILES